MYMLRTIVCVSCLLVLCSCTRVVPRAELDDLNRSLDVRTVLFEPEFSLYSPYTLEKTEDFRNIVVEELGALSDLFAREIPEPILIQLVAVDDLTPQIHDLEGEELSVRMPGRSVIGYASLREVVVYVSKDRTVNIGGAHEISLAVDPKQYRKIIRHELAHAFIHRHQLPSNSWIQEGIAEAIETFDLVDGCFLPHRPLRVPHASLDLWRPRILGPVLDDIGARRSAAHLRE